MRRFFRVRCADLLILILISAIFPHASGAQSEPGAIPPFTATGTDLIVRTDDGPRAMLQVEIERPLEFQETLLVVGLDGAELARVRVGPGEGGRVLRFPVPMPPEGGVLPLDVHFGTGESAFHQRLELAPPDPDWVLHFIPGFHFDPVWWNTQANYMETGKLLDAHVGPGIELVGEYLDWLAKDPDTRVAFHQLPYLKNFLEARPWRREELLAQVEAGRAGIVGGTYNELSTTLVGLEAAIRNVAYGTLWQREVLGGSGDVFWQCDVFGHDPSFPGLMRRAGHRGGVFGRGPFHQWGTDRDRVNFPSEFMWVSPDGAGILTHYLSGHYFYAYSKFASGSNRASGDREVTRAIVSEMFGDLKRPALTHHVLLPLHVDFIRPLENLPDVVRDWNAAFIAPKAVIDTSDGFFTAVEDEIRDRGIVPPVITRDMNPIYTGCGVSFADLKLAEREVENTLREAELFATIAAIEGVAYPYRALDRAWRQLLFNAHHDAVTGSMSDQVYIDILFSYRDALEIARAVRFAALCSLAQHVEGDGPLVWNPVAHPRQGWWLAEDVQDGRGKLYRADIPPIGVRRISPEPPVDQIASVDSSRPVLVNEHLRVELDLSLGGAIVSIIDRATGDELLDGPANDVVLVEEYAVLPGHGEGPWHLAPTGARRSGTGVEARLFRPDASRPYRLELEAKYPEFTKRQSIELLPGARRIDCETSITRWQGRNQLLRVEFPFRHPGARPVFQTAAAVIGRPYARDVDVAADPWTLDQTCGHWVGLGRVAAIEVVVPDGPLIRRAIGVGEIVVGASAGPERMREANEIARALVSLGVTSTITREDARRYGDLDVDSNLPDFRLYLGGVGELDLVAALESDGLPPADRGGCRYLEPGPAGAGVDLPTLFLGSDAESRRLFLASLARDGAVVLPVESCRLAPGPSVADRGIAIVNRGTVSCRVESNGMIALNLLRSCTSWPSGLWIDPPERTHPDGSPLGVMHGSHQFRYAIVPHEGDHRTADLAARGQEVQHPPIAQLYRAGDGTIEDGRSWLAVEPASVLLTAFKPAGYDLAQWNEEETAPLREVVARVWNGTGSETDAIIRPGFPVTNAAAIDLLESTGRELQADEVGAFHLTMGPHEVATIRFRLERSETPPVALGLERRVVSPSAYWLENLGEGVDGNGVFALAPRDRALVIGPEGVETRLHVVNGHRSRTWAVPLTSRASAGLEVILDPPQVEVGPGEDVEVLVRVIPRDPSWRGRSAIEITTPQPGGAITAAIWVRDRGTAEDSPSVEIVPFATLVPPRGELRATVSNLTDGPLRGVASWITPMVAWSGIAKWQQEIDLPPFGEVDVVARLATRVDSYAILRFTAAGEVTYGESIALLENPGQVLLSFDVDRVRITESGIGVANLVARSLRGLDAASTFDIRAPEGWQVEEIARAFTPSTDENREQSLEVSLAISLDRPSGGGVLLAAGPGGSRTSVETTVAPVQRARRAAETIRIDGDLSEWDDGEFTHSEGELGEARAAVRYDSGGLFLAFEVTDDLQRQSHSAATIWQGDSVQFALTAAPGTDIGYSSSDLEFGVALTPVGPLVWCWYAGPDGRTGAVVEADVAAVPFAGGIRYELRIPRTRLPGIGLEPGAVLGFSYIANDDDGDGYRGAIEWTPGMTGGKDSSLFGELHLRP